MDSTLIFRNDDGTTNTWRCQEIGIQRLLADEYNTLLGEAYLFWSDFVHPSVAFDFDASRKSGPPATKAQIANPALAPIFRVDCRSQNPFDFTIELPTMVHDDITVRDLGPDYIRRIVALDLNYAKGYRKPLYQNIKQEIDGIARQCYRLLLPVLGATHEVAEIFGFCRPESVAHPVAPLRAREKTLPRRE